jgi:hypothetical protein
LAHPGSSSGQRSSIDPTGNWIINGGPSDESAHFFFDYSSAQLAIFPQQTGVTNIGSAGMEWHDVIIENVGGFATWRVDGLQIASVDLSTVTLGGGNIFFGHSDVNTTSSTDPNDVHLLFTLIDNIQVTAIPAPGSIALLGLAGLLGGRPRRRSLTTWTR